ncbi:MAG TPA: hypothetical protein VE172_03765 [Stackebrandtia sp.]|nr:hypothetical protein [Stackebrandtia sp.]HZE37906.1 hypothetical protein [Stackebrandtia sp.]
MVQALDGADLVDQVERAFGDGDAATMLEGDRLLHSTDSPSKSSSPP